jgi:predicted XRE-type DNA-binding protein
MESEIWKDIKDFEGIYQVSNMGRVKSVGRLVNSGKGVHSFTIKEKILAVDYSASYYRVTLSKNGKIKRFSVHRLVASTFISNPENKPQVNHKDGDKLNNKLDNLEWVTVSENNRHAIDTGLSIPVKGEDHGMCKLKESDILEIRRLYHETNLTQQQIGDMFGIDRKYATEIISGECWKHVKIYKKTKKKCKIGVNHHNSKIDENMARQIKELLYNGNKPKDISDSLGVSRDIVYDIKREKTWKHVK